MFDKLLKDLKEASTVLENLNKAMKEKPNG